MQDMRLDPSNETPTHTSGDSNIPNGLPDCLSLHAAPRDDGLSPSFSGNMCFACAGRKVQVAL